MGRQLSRSCGDGRFCGGGQRTTAVTHAPTASNPSSRPMLSGWFDNPARHIAPHSHSPDRSPVKTRPVRLPPWAAGASPTTARAAPGVPEPGQGAPPVLLPGERGPWCASHLLSPSPPNAGRGGTLRPRPPEPPGCHPPRHDHTGKSARQHRDALRPVGATKVRRRRTTPTPAASFGHECLVVRPQPPPPSSCLSVTA